jgi:hypothetical protein
MTTHAMRARRSEKRPLDGKRWSASNAATVIAMTLFLAVLIAEAVFLAVNAPSVADLGALAATAGSVP